MDSTQLNTLTIPKQHSKAPFKTLFKRFVFLIVGAIMVAFALELFFVPNNIIDGGVVGLSLMAAYLSKLPLGIFLFIINLPFLYLGYKQIGKTFAISTSLAVTVLSISTYFVHKLAIHATEEPLLAAVFGGIMLGVGVGIVIRYGGALDGTEIIAILLNKTLPFSVGEVVMFFNVFILGSAGFVFGWDRAMFSLIGYYVAFKVIDITIEGIDESKSVWIISEKYRDIGEAILDRLGRGVTYLHGEGAYSGDDKNVIFTVITRLEEAKLKSIVEEKDPGAFLAVGNIHDVKGGRFKKRDIH